MEHTTYISFLSYHNLLPGPVCLPDHNDEPMKKFATQLLDFQHGKGSAEVVEKPPFTLNYQSVTMVEPEKGFEIDKPFRAKINTIMSRKLDVPEQKMGYLGCSLESMYMNKLVENITTRDGTVFNTDGNAEVGFDLAPHRLEEGKVYRVRGGAYKW